MSEIVETVVQALNTSSSSSNSSSGALSLQAITAALVQLEHRGVIERLPPRASDQQSAVAVDARLERLARKRKSLALSSTERSLFFRKVPKRPLKALKAWKTVVTSTMVDGMSR
ncbi:hypothetical protein PINS_up005235 [Pythium insidiosum]|nr:hypothetical protein PINS_up005235 [Pythium insidiosum]